MRNVTYLLTFKPGVRLEDAELTLKLALLACEGVHGARRVQNACSFHADFARHGLMLRTDGTVGPTVARVLSTFLAHEFGKDAFSLRRRDRDIPTTTKHARRPRAAA